MKIEKRMVYQWIYTTENGKEILVDDMDSRHLLNAYTKACQEKEDDDPIIEVLKSEILLRMTRNFNQKYNVSE